MQNAAKFLEVPGIEDVRLNPSLKSGALARDFVPRLIKTVVTFVVAVCIRWRRAARNTTNRGNRPARKDASVGPGLQVVDNFFDGDDRLFRGKDGLFLHAEDSPQQDVAFAIGFLGVDYGHVRPNGRNRGQGLRSKRALDKFDLLVELWKVGTGVGAQHRKRKIRSSGNVSIGKIAMTMFLNFQRTRPLA